MNPLANFLRLGCTGIGLALANTAVAVPDFEDKPVGTIYTVGDSDTSNGVAYSFSDFEQTPGNYSSTGEATVDGLGYACGAYPGNELNLDNIFVTFDYAASGGSVPGMYIHFAWYGGVINLSVNGTRAWALNPSALPAALGGCTVTIYPTGTNCWLLAIVGTSDTIGIGGQEFWIDSSEFDGDGPECDFGYEDLEAPMIFPVYTSFETDSLPSKVKAIVHMDGSLHDTGDVTVSLDNLACHDGKELRIHDAVVSHDFLAYGTPYENVAWAYGYYEGCVNFEVNGDHRVEPDIMALNGQIIGGCAISVIPSGNPCGWIFVNGIVETISAGGQNLVLDCLTGDEFESGIVGDVDDDDDVDVDDLMALIGVYGSDCPACPEDLDDDSDVDVDDLMILLGNYGA